MCMHHNDSNHKWHSLQLRIVANPISPSIRFQWKCTWLKWVGVTVKFQGFRKFYRRVKMRREKSKFDKYTEHCCMVFIIQYNRPSRASETINRNSSFAFCLLFHSVLIVLLSFDDHVCTKHAHTLSRSHAIHSISFH